MPIDGDVEDAEMCFGMNHLQFSNIFAAERLA